MFFVREVAQKRRLWGSLVERKHALTSTKPTPEMFKGLLRVCIRNSLSKGPLQAHVVYVGRFHVSFYRLQG